MMLKKIFAICRKSHGLLGSVTDGFEGDWNVMAALRMNGVVKPQQRPTMRKDEM
jgi:hypothetical protein